MIKLADLIEGKGMIQINHPENSQYQVAKSWDEPNLFEFDQEKIQNTLEGRELQTLQDVRKIATRLRLRGIPSEEIQQFINSFITA